MDKIQENIAVSSGLFEKEKEFWEETLSGDTPFATFIQNYSDIGNSKQSANAKIEFQFPASIYQEISRIANGSDYGIYAILLSGVYSILARFSGCTDIIIGSPVFKQNGDVNGGVHRLINYTLPLRLQFSNDITIKGMLYRITTMLNNANRNMNYPFDKMLEIREGNRLFDVFVSLDSIHCKTELCCPQCNFIFAFRCESSGLQGTFSYNPEAMEQREAQNIVNCFLNYIKCILENMKINLNRVDLISNEDRQRLLFDFNNTDADYPKDKTICKLIEERAKNVPENTALIFEDQSVTYSELLQKVHQTALLLRRKGVMHGDTVAVLMPRSIELVIGILGILKAGAVCLPIDMNYPPDRIRYLLRDSRTRAILCGDRISFNLKEEAVQFIYFNFEILHSIAEDPIPEEASSSDAAYMIYTSGSTGQPKGVVLQHSGIVNHVFIKISEVQISECDRMCLSLNLNFVASIWQILTPLFLGIPLFIYKEDITMNPYQLMQRIDKDRISVIELVPAVLNAYLSLIENDQNKLNLCSLKKIVLTGERVQSSLIRKIFSAYGDQIKMINAYGQSECSDDTLHYHIPFDRGIENVPIGKAANNTKIYILNEAMQLQPIGAIGELFISGEGISRGYFGKPELTNEKFVNNPYLPGKKMYATGDMVRWGWDGTVEYLGRKDHQVKIRGNRIELGEIEAIILNNDAVKDAAVLLKKGSQSDCLCAYITLRKSVTVKELRSYLKLKLPEYMIPRYIIVMDKFKLTPNGKVDRKAFPEPLEENLSREEYQAPHNEIEENLIKIWSEVLSIPKISIHDHFFDLGGDSLKAIRVISRIQRMGFEVPVNILYSSSVREIAELLAQMQPSTAVYNSFEDVNTMVKSKIDLGGLLVERNVDKKTFYVLMLSPSCKIDYPSIYEIFRQNCTKKFWPHYIISSGNIMNTPQSQQLDEDRFDTMLSLKDESQKELVNCILEKLDDAETNYEQAIVKQKVIHTFPCSGMQKGTARLNGHLTGNIYHIDYLGDENEIFKALYHIVCEQELLRSVLSENGKDFWKEYDMPNKIEIPYVDLSGYSLKTKEKVIESIVQKKYFKLYFGLEKLLYRFILVRENLREFKLIAPIDHILFDAASSEIISKNLKKSLNNSMEAIQESGNFKNYISQMLQGPFCISPEVLIQKFSLQEYQQYTNRIENHILSKSDDKAHSMKFKINIQELNHAGNVSGVNTAEEKIWEISFYFAILLCKQIFHVDKVPMKLFYYGRSYLQRNFYNAIGFFTDVLPVLITSDENSMGDMAAQVQNAIAIVKKHNINFACLKEYEHLKAQWGKALEYLTPHELDANDQLILYNFQGKRENFDRVKKYFDQGSEYLDQFRLEGASLSFISYYTDEYIYLDLLSVFEIDETEIRKIFNYNLKTLL